MIRGRAGLPPRTRPAGEFATPRENLSKHLGYQADTAAVLKEARALTGAAGHADGLKGHCQVNRCEDVCGQSEGDSEP